MTKLICRECEYVGEEKEFDAIDILGEPCEEGMCPECEATEPWDYEPLETK